MLGGGLIKHDLHTGASETHDFGPGTHAAEPVFVPASDDAAEDDGHVITFVYDENTNGSDLVILHAQDFAGDPVAVDPPARSVCRTASTATGCPTPPDRVRARATVSPRWCPDGRCHVLRAIQISSAGHWLAHS